MTTSSSLSLSKSKSKLSLAKKSSFLSTLPSQRRLLRRVHHQQKQQQYRNKEKSNNEGEYNIQTKLLGGAEKEKERNSKKEMSNSQDRLAVTSTTFNMPTYAIKKERKDSFDAQKFNRNKSGNKDDRKDTNFEVDDSNDAIIKETEEEEENERILFENITNECMRLAKKEKDVGCGDGINAFVADIDDNYSNNSHDGTSGRDSNDATNTPPPFEVTLECMSSQTGAVRVDLQECSDEKKDGCQSPDDMEMVVEGTILEGENEEEKLHGANESKTERFNQREAHRKRNDPPQSKKTLPPSHGVFTSTSSLNNVTQDVTVQINALVQSVVQQQTFDLQQQVESMRCQLSQENTSLFDTSLPNDIVDWDNNRKEPRYSKNFHSVQTSLAQQQQKERIKLQNLHIQLRYKEQQCEMEQEKNKALQQMNHLLQCQVEKFQSLFRESQEQLLFLLEKKKTKKSERSRIMTEDETAEEEDEIIRWKESACNERESENDVIQKCDTALDLTSKRKHAQQPKTKHFKITGQPTRRQDQDAINNQNVCNLTSSKPTAQKEKRKSPPSSQSSSSQNTLKSIAASARKSVLTKTNNRKHDRQRRRHSFSDVKLLQQCHLENQQEGQEYLHLPMQKERKEEIHYGRNSKARGEEHRENRKKSKKTRPLSPSSSSASSAPSSSSLLSSEKKRFLNLDDSSEHVKEGQEGHQNKEGGNIDDKDWVGRNILFGVSNHGNASGEDGALNVEIDIVESDIVTPSSNKTIISTNKKKSRKNSVTSTNLTFNDDNKMEKINHERNDRNHDYSQDDYFYSDNDIPKTREGKQNSALMQDNSKKSFQLSNRPNPYQKRSTTQPKAKTMMPPPPKQQNGENSGNREQQQPHKYKEVVRCRDKRRTMPGHACEHCVKFIDAVCGPADGGDGVFDRDKMIMDCSRHRANHSPDHTPDGFWELSFADEIAARKEGEEELQRNMMDN